MPSLVINTNVPSINGQRNLLKSTRSLNKALEHLSSGLRITRAGDDAAGLAISENLRSQIRGMNQASRNANDAISLIQTAEGALETYTEIAQRIRQLAIQSSSDLNSTDNRRTLQLEVDEQIEELDRIANTMQFNGLPLLDGTFINKRIQSGANAGDTLQISVGDLRKQVIGSVAQSIGLAVNATQFQDGSILINGVGVPSSATGSARDKATAINSVYHLTNVFARVEAAQTGDITEATPSAVADIEAGTLDADAGDMLLINGVVIPKSGSLTVLADDANGALRRAINEVSQETGVKASVVASGTGNQLVLTATNDLDFTYEMTAGSAAGAVRDIVGLPGADDVEIDVYGRVRLISDSSITVSDGTGTALDLLGMTGSTTISTTSAIENIDISTYEGAQEAILQIDNALRQINDMRASLGALTNRLEGTVSNMLIAAENLTASESRIRDADFAAETAALTRAQILQQAGIAALAQANQTPQTALQLLQ